MPIIPKLQESQVLEQRAPVQQVETTAGREFGEGLAAFGQGVQRAAQGVADLYRVERFKKDKEAQIQYQEAEAAQTEAAQRRSEERLADPGKEPSGKDLVPRFNEAYGEDSAAILDRVTNPEAKRLAKARGQEIGVQYRQKLYNESNVLFVQNAVLVTEELVDQKAHSVFSNPDAYKEYFESAEGHIRMMEGIVRNDMIPSARRKVYQKMATNYILGRATQGKPELARKELLDPQSNIGRLVGAENHQALINQIRDIRMGKLNDDIRIEGIQNERMTRKLEAERENNYRDFLGKQYDGENIETEVKIYHAAGKLSEQHNTALVGIRKELSDATSELAYTLVVAKATDARNPISQVRNDVLKLMSEPTPGDGPPALSRPHAREAFKYLDTLQKGRASRSPEENKRFDERKRLLYQQMGTALSPITGDFSSNDDKIRGARARVRFTDLVYRDGMNIEEAYERALKESPRRITFGDIPAIPGLSIIDYENPDSVKKGYDFIKANKSNMTKERFDSAFNALKILEQLHKDLKKPSIEGIE